MLTARKAICISRSRLTAFSFYHVILKNPREMGNGQVRTSWSCATAFVMTSYCCDHLQLRQYNITWSQDKSQLFLPRLLTWLREGDVHTQLRFCQRGIAKSSSTCFNINYSSLQLLMWWTHIAVKQTGIDLNSASYRQLNSRGWHALMTAVTEPWHTHTSVCSCIFYTSAATSVTNAHLGFSTGNRRKVHLM